MSDEPQSETTAPTEKTRPEPEKLARYKVVRGIKAAGKGCAVVSPLTCIRLGLSDVTRKAVKIGATTLRLQVKSELRDDIVAIMAKDRKALGVELGATVVLAAATAEQDTATDDVSVPGARRLTVKKGSKDDPDDPPTARLHSELLRQVRFGGAPSCALSAGAAGERVTVKCCEGERVRSTNHVGLRKGVREKIGVGLDGEALFWCDGDGGARAALRTELSGLAERVIIADKPLVELEVDAIVNAANEQLRGGGGVDGAIHAAAGRELRRACGELGSCRTGDAVATPGFELPAGHVFHAVGPKWQDGRNDEHRLLGSAYRRALELAEQKEAKTVAFPCISTGVYRFPLADATVIAFSEITLFLRTHERPEKVYVCPFTDQEKAAYASLLSCLRGGIAPGSCCAVQRAKRGAPDDSVGLTGAAAAVFGAEKGAGITIRGVGGEACFTVSIEKAEYPVYRCRLNAKARKQLGVEPGGFVQLGAGPAAEGAVPEEPQGETAGEPNGRDEAGQDRADQEGTDERDV